MFRLRQVRKGDSVSNRLVYCQFVVFAAGAMAV
jgi:hypothetical protein